MLLVLWQWRPDKKCCVCLASLGFSSILSLRTTWEGLSSPSVLFVSSSPSEQTTVICFTGSTRGSGMAIKSSLGFVLAGPKENNSANGNWGETVSRRRNLWRVWQLLTCKTTNMKLVKYLPCPQKTRQLASKEATGEKSKLKILKNVRKNVLK